ncbi:MAG: hypothetical protein KJ985_00075, partial [Proteobacteria bacterium]|nr:hypothetical protein [Pseudomonadota bacterium]
PFCQFIIQSFAEGLFTCPVTKTVDIDFIGPTQIADKYFKLKYLIYVCNLSGPNKINVYGFGDWTGK